MLFKVCRCEVLQVKNISFQSLFPHKEFVQHIILYINSFSNFFILILSMSFFKTKCLVRLNIFTDITKTCVHRTLANCRAKPGIFASSSLTCCNAMLWHAMGHAFVCIRRPFEFWEYSIFQNCGNQNHRNQQTDSKNTCLILKWTLFQILLAQSLAKANHYHITIE